ncbi:hypothetical protein [Dictyobacter kobayashii]|uniref:Uncharacterized protein n=1 Tax=Dictyobacter kobayashii TaxID=2014872 RepID=A0A402AQ94_9CHLR|nr:hypothetical protein [Dictyobacter kobayashii]GCE21205.1 hypothetical protein KDK_50050 [Dictyobacter kobayashii]
MIILEICLTIVTSIALLGLGFYGLKHNFPLIATEEQLQKSLNRWQVFAEVQPSPKMLADIKQSWRYLRAITLIGGGLGLILMLIGVVIISLLTTGTVDGSDAGDSAFFTAITYASLFVGFGIGGIFAVWRLRKAAQSHITYADLHQRRLSDYRNGLIHWLLALGLVETIAFSCFFAPHLGSTLRLLQSNGAPLDIPNNLWILSIVPGAIVVISIVAELLMLRIAHLSRLLVTSDPTVSQRADDMLRANVIGMVQIYALITIFYLGLLQNTLIIRSLWAAGYWKMSDRPYSAISSLFYFLFFLTLGLGGVLVATYGPPRGKNSGRPWQTKRINQ